MRPQVCKSGRLRWSNTVGFIPHRRKQCCDAVWTVTHKVLFVLLILAHERRRLIHFNVTEHPTAEWTAQQVVQAFPWDEAPQYLLRDRDRIYGTAFRQRVRNLGITEVLSAPCSPWQNPYVERLTRAHRARGGWPASSL